MNSTTSSTQQTHKKFAYAITDRTLKVLAIDGALSLFNNENHACPGGALLNLVPELVGQERALAEILAGERPSLEVTWIERQGTDGQKKYLNMMIHPYRDPKTGQITGLIQLIDDVTEWGRVEQQLTQTREAMQRQQKYPVRRALNWPPKADMPRSRGVRLGSLSSGIHRLLWFASDNNRTYQPLAG